MSTDDKRPPSPARILRERIEAMAPSDAYIDVEYVNDRGRRAVRREATNISVSVVLNGPGDGSLTRRIETIPGCLNITFTGDEGRSTGEAAFIMGRGRIIRALFKKSTA